jgi:hypothetical protein
MSDDESDGVPDTDLHHIDPAGDGAERGSFLSKSLEERF